MVLQKLEVENGFSVAINYAAAAESGTCNTER